MMTDENTTENADVTATEKPKKDPISKQRTIPLPLLPQVDKIIADYRAEAKAKIDAARNAKKKQAALAKLALAQAAYDEIENQDTE